MTSDLSRPLRVAIIGCGKIADQHVEAIHRLSNCDIVGVCDREPLMAQQLGERFGISQRFSDALAMLQTTKPDVAHITTPPQSHFALAKQCLEFGSHVYLEKPFTVIADEAEALISFAQSRDLKITAGHNYQFTLEMLEMRQLVGKGFLGGDPLHLESYWSYDLGDASYVGPVLGNRSHWVRQLPGQLFHNIISHGIARVAEFLDDDIVETAVSVHQSPRLRRLFPQEIPDELRVMIRDKRDTTAFFCFSTQIKALNQLRIYGPSGSLTADLATGSLTRRENRAYKSYLAYFIPPLKDARQHLRNACRNLTNFLRQRLYQDFGMTELVRRFYDSIRTGSEPPIPYREIILTSRIMDEVFAQTQTSPRRFAVAAELSSDLLKEQLPVANA